MTDYTYSRVAALNFNTTPVTVGRSATGSVYAIGDTTFTTPLNVTTVVGGVTGTSISSDANGFFPDFTVANRTSVVFKQAGTSFTSVLTTTDPVPGPQGATGAAGATGAKGDRGDLATWQTATWYPLNQVISNPVGDLVKVTTAHTSGVSYDATKFDYVVPPTLTPAALNDTIDDQIEGSTYLPATFAPVAVASNRPLNAGDPQWGIDRTGATDTTVALQALLDAANVTGRSVYLPHGEYLITQLVVPRITLRGAGLGGFGASAAEAATLLRQTTVTGAKSALIFTGTTTAGNTNENVGPFEVSDMIIRCTGGAGAGHGIEFRSVADPYSYVQDTVVLRNLLIRGFTKSGIKVPAGARPLRFNQVNLLFNKEYGIDYDQRSPYLTQAIHFDNVSGDGNLLGLIRCVNMDKHGSVLVTNLKSEKRVNSAASNAVGQEDALIFENCDDTPVTVAGLTHVSSVESGATFEPPRAAIRIKGTGKPRVSYSGIAVRVRGTDVAGSPATVWDEIDSITVPVSVSAGEYGGTSGDSAWVDHPNIRATALTSGESTMDRRETVVAAATLSAGSLRLTYFTARKTETIANVRTIAGSTAAVGSTLCRVGIYSVASNGDLSLVASCANDATLWSATATRYTKALSASFMKKRGQRYAVGCLVVGASTAPNVHGQSSLHADEAGESPRLCGLLTGQTDLPSSISAGSVANTTIQVYAALTP